MSRTSMSRRFRYQFIIDNNNSSHLVRTCTVDLNKTQERDLKYVKKIDYFTADYYQVSMGPVQKR